MRYLWIEDFDGGQNEKALKEKWIKYFDLEQKELVIKHDLISALKYMKEYERDFDAVLLDIRFPVSFSNLSEKKTDEIFDEYFQPFLTKEFYDKNIEGGDSGTGILVYMYLIFAMKFPKERIAFLSANIEERKVSGRMLSNKEKLETLKEYIVKFEKCEYTEQILTELREVYEIDIDDKENDGEVHYKDDDYIEYAVELIEYEIQDLEEKGEVQQDISHLTESQLAFNRAESAFKSIGINIENAYSKPKYGVNGKSDEFISYVNSIETEYVKVRRLIFSLVEMIMDELSLGSIRLMKNGIFRNESEVYGIAYFQDILDEILSMPLVEDELNNCSRYKKIIWSLTHCMESTSYPKPIKKWYKINCHYKGECEWKDGKDDNKNYKYCSNENPCVYKYDIHLNASHTILRLIRNWLAHERIKGDQIELEFYVFLSALALRFVFDIDGLKKKDDYIEIERKLLNKGINRTNIDTKEIENNLKVLADTIYSKGRYNELNDNIAEIITDWAKKGSKGVRKKEDVYKAFVLATAQPFFERRQNQTDFSYALKIDTSFLNKIISNSDYQYAVEYFEYAYRRFSK